ncbi:MAG: alpha/beta hydrolase [Burkholderiales bacterium]|nr:alpha/beta hydrolase [Burkholderiales bacterium]
MTPDLGFVHRFVPGTIPGRTPLLLLHGTGGDENDLLPLGREVAPGAALLSPRGRVMEGPMPRFFRRLAEGVFDTQDVIRRAAELAAFVEAARAAYGLARPIALGFSNGANIAAATLLLHPQALAGAVLMRALAPVDPPSPPALAGVPVLVLTGNADPINPVAKAQRLVNALADAGAEIAHEVVAGGHGLTQKDVELATAWLARH